MVLENRKERNAGCRKECDAASAPRGYSIGWSSVSLPSGDSVTSISAGPHSLVTGIKVWLGFDSECLCYSDLLFSWYISIFSLGF